MYNAKTMKSAIVFIFLITATLMASAQMKTVATTEQGVFSII